jgi:hypothetical protein
LIWRWKDWSSPQGGRRWDRETPLTVRCDRKFARIGFVARSPVSALSGRAKAMAGTRAARDTFVPPESNHLLPSPLSTLSLHPLQRRQDIPGCNPPRIITPFHTRGMYHHHTIDLRRRQRFSSLRASRSSLKQPGGPVSTGSNDSQFRSPTLIDTQDFPLIRLYYCINLNASSTCSSPLWMLV